MFLFIHLGLVSQAKIRQKIQIMTQKLHILVLIAFLAGIIAPACGFMWGGQYSVIEICTTDGIESRVVMNEGQQNSPHQNMQDQCEFCFSNANIISFLPSKIIISQNENYAEKLRFRDYESIALSRLNTDTSPRGPPIFI